MASLIRQLVGRGQELVQRRVEEPHGHGQPVHGREDGDEVLPLDDAQLLERGSLLVGRVRPGSSAARPAAGPRRGTCARSGTGRSPRRPARGRWPRRRRCRRWPARPGARVRMSSAHESTVSKSAGGSAAVEGHLSDHHHARCPRRARSSPPRRRSRRRTVTWWSPIRSASAPTTAGLPQPRATTAAWLTRPPRAVRIPSAASMPWTSSGEVSLRTRITGSPRGRCGRGVVGGEVDPADCGARAGPETLGPRLVAGPRRTGGASTDVEVVLGDPADTASALEIPRSFGRDHVDGHLQRGARRCACPPGSGASRACPARW